jgi:hypothetical protein
MSSFNCEKCGTPILDTPGVGYVTGCEHYPLAKKDSSDMRYYYTPQEYRDRLEEDFEKRWANY